MADDPLQRTPAQLALARQIRRDMIIDLVGNSALALGLWGWFGDAERLSVWLKEPALFIALTATGLLNLLHLPARLRRLKEWQQTR